MKSRWRVTMGLCHTVCQILYTSPVGGDREHLRCSDLTVLNTTLFWPLFQV